MNLTIDIGNTRAKTGLFDTEHLVDKRYWDTDQLDDIMAYATNHLVKNIILSTVKGDPAPEWEHVLRTRFCYLRLDHHTPLPIQNDYATPETLGKDRLAAIVGAWQLYSGEACLVIDAGTCITYDLLSPQGIYRGGNISPGIDMRLRAMHTFTARLPLVARSPEWETVGRSTDSALLTGGQLGAALEVEGFIRLFAQEYAQLRVLMTGGDADFFANALKSKIFVEPDLVLIGLNKILSYNAESLV